MSLKDQEILVTRGMARTGSNLGQSKTYLCISLAPSTSGTTVMATTPMVHVTPNILMNAQMLEAAYAAQVEKFLSLGSTTGYPPSGIDPLKKGRCLKGNRTPSTSSQAG